MAELASHFGGQIFAVVLIGLVSVLAAWTTRFHRPWAFGLVPWATCLTIGSALAIASVTLSRRSNARSPGHLQLHPFATMRGYWWDGRYDFVVYLLGNIALFAPLGFFLYLALRRGVLRAGLLTAAASVAVEVLQIPIWSRSTDVDDVICNSVGGLAGAVAAFVVLRFWTTLAAPPPPPRPAARHLAGTRG